MALHVKCPGCGSLLTAPDHAAGQTLQCPQCQKQFLIPPHAAAAAPPERSQFFPPGFAPPSTASAQPPSTASAQPTSARPAQPPPSAPPIATAASSSPPAYAPAYFPPPNGPAAPLEPLSPFAPAYPPVSVASAAPMPTSAPPMPASTPWMAPPSSPHRSAPAPRKTSSAAPASAAPAAAPARSTQAARFIAADASATKVDLAADGRLPALVLEESPEAQTIDDKPQGGNPMVLIGTLAFSILASVAMLFVEPSTGGGESFSKGDARSNLVLFYLPNSTAMEKGARLEPYQVRLRQALLAYNRGDRDEERRLYRQVLDMLHSEDKNRFKGLTGSAVGDAPPNDRHLESLVSVLLSHD